MKISKSRRNMFFIVGVIVVSAAIALAAHYTKSSFELELYSESTGSQNFVVQSVPPVPGKHVISFAQYVPDPQSNIQWSPLAIGELGKDLTVYDQAAHKLPFEFVLYESASTLYLRGITAGGIVDGRGVKVVPVTQFEVKPGIWKVSNGNGKVALLRVTVLSDLVPTPNQEVQLGYKFEYVEL